jgi:lipopolysaccharide transport system ATP-binding protein
MSDIAIRVEKLSKQFRIGMAKYSYYTLRDQLVDSMKSILRRGRKPHSRNDMIWALKDVSFEVKRGEVVGIIGRNGAGKSTLLKILSRITEPTKGQAEIQGRVGSLLEVGTGFHPELTGRDNIYLNGAILGMKKAEIDRKFDEIVAFSEIEKFIDTPVKRYSSGMYVRLAFAVAAHLEPEILIVDEVLAVGDASFQKKCLGKMGTVAKEGRTILFVSHNMAAILNICRRVMLLESGLIVCQGEPIQIIDRYLTTDRKHNVFLPGNGEEVGGDRVRIENFRVSPNQPRTGMPVEFTFTISCDDQTEKERIVELAISFLSEEGVRLFQLYSRDMGLKFTIPMRTIEIAVRMEKLPLAPGRYLLNLWAGEGNKPIHWLMNCFTLSVEAGYIGGEEAVTFRGYPVILPSDWHVHA